MSAYLEQLNTQCDKAWVRFNKHVESCPTCRENNPECGEPPYCPIGESLYQSCESIEETYYYADKNEVAVKN